MVGTTTTVPSSGDNDVVTVPSSGDNDVVGRPNRVDAIASAEEVVSELRSMLDRAVGLVSVLQADITPAAPPPKPPVDTDRIAALEQRLAAVEEDGQELARRLVEADQRSGQLMSLYVATYQLHSTLDPDDVQSTIAEIAMDLLGADKFVLLLRDDGRGDYEVAMSEGLTASDTLYANGRYGVGDPMVDEALDTGVLQIGPYPRSQAIAVVPLSVQQSTVGVLVLLKLLSHKPALRAGDRDMLDLLGAHAASALFAARLFAATDRKRRTLEGLMQLVRGA